MNYLKKIKALGFKKIPATAVCSYEYDYHGLNGERISGYYLKELSLVILEGNPNIIPRSAFHNSIKTYTYYSKISNTLSFYLTLVGSEYTFVIKDDTLEDIRHGNQHIRKCNIYIPIHSNKLGDNFWKEILSSLDKDIQRELLIKEIFSSQ